jgi:addiction module HigA family antidote
MAMTTTPETVHPGTILDREVLQPRKLTQSQLADALGISLVRLNALVGGRRGMTPDTALRLERVIGIPAEKWIALQAAYDLAEARRAPETRAIAKLRRLRRTVP